MEALTFNLVKNDMMSKLDFILFMKVRRKRMNYLILVSHGRFAEGLKDALSMFIGDEIKTVKAVGMHSGEDTAKFEERFKSLLSELEPEANLIVLGDIIGGSPLTTAINIIHQSGQLSKTTILGGMNFPMALNTAILKDSLDPDNLTKAVLTEATTAVKKFELSADDDDDEI
jgi:N-acetylgalactosamine PTS system EIIA component